MTIADSDDAARAADVQQARYLETELEAEHRRLVDRITERQDLIRNGLSTSREISELHRAEDELRRLEAMLLQLRRRFDLQPDD